MPGGICSFMAGKKHTQKDTPLPLSAIVQACLRALENREDFILTREPRPGEDSPETGPVIHILTGNLITPCRLNNLMGRALADADEGARVVTIREKDLLFAPEK